MYLGAYQEYNFLQGLGESTNQAWVNRYQNPFNQGPLAQAAALAATDKAAAYNLLAPAFAQIQADAAAFVASYPPNQRGSAQATIDGWHKDFPLINGFLNDWRQYVNAAPVAIPATTAAPVSTVFSSDPGQPAVYGGTAPAVFSPSGGPSAYVPSAAPIVNVSAPAGAVAAPSMLEGWAPWLIGATAVGLILSSGSRGGGERRRRRRR